MNPCRAKETDRTFLYIMVFISMLSSCEAESDLAEIKQHLGMIEEDISNDAE